MIIKISYLVVAFLLFSSGVGANAEHTTSELEAMMPDGYQALKQKASSGRKVRVIARVKNVETGNLTSNLASNRTLPEAVDHAAFILDSYYIKAARKLPRLGVLVYEVDESALVTLVTSGLFDMIVEDIPEAPAL